MRITLLFFAMFVVGLMTYAEVPLNNVRARDPSHRSTAARAKVSADELTQLIDLPNIPRYPGKALFLRGFRCPDERYVGLTLGINEPPDQVKSWYEDALKTYSWKVLKSTSGPNHVIAIKDDNTFSMMILSREIQGVRTVVDLSFYYGR